MKLNRWVWLGLVSTSMVFVPVSQTIAAQPAIQILAQAQTGAIASGSFVAGEVPTTGTARIVTEGGHRYLVLDSAFSTGNMGPDLHVLLDTATQPPQSYSNLGSAVNLGSLQSFTGEQRYPIPDAINVSDFHTVVIWCRMANATFGYATLNF